MDAISELKSVWFLVVPLVIMVVWLVRLEAIAKGNSSIIIEQKRSLASAFKKLDTISEDYQVTKSKVGIHGGMLNPEKLADHYTITATFQANTEKDIEYLIKDVDGLKKKTNLL